MNKIKLSKYEISNMGNLRNYITKKHLLLNPNKNCGYILKSLDTDDNIRKQFSVHRLVLQTFLGEPKNNETCDHINRIKIDNKLPNLRWINISDQNKNQNKNKNTKKMSNLLELDVNNNIIKKFTSIVEACNYYKCSKNVIHRSLKLGKISRKLGTCWKYDESDFPGEIWHEEKINGILVKLSNMGRLKKNNRIMLGSKNGGYITTKLSKKNLYIHVLIAKSFLKNNDIKKSIVNHIDGNKSNNVITNLEWVTQSENMKHSFTYKGSTRFQISIKQIDPVTLKIINTFNSILSAYKSTKVNRQYISQVINGKKTLAGGFIWRKV